MYRIFPKIGRSGHHGRSYLPNAQKIPLYELGFLPSTAYLLFR